MLHLLLPLVFLVIPAISHAETKILTAEAAYIMGDGETPSFAEAMALQKAKQMALEQAGTYVESYTKVKNLDLTHEEIQTIAGGVLEVQVLEKNRTLVGDGLRFSIKIKATVTTDKMEDLAQRIKGKNVAEEYKKLQEDYARLSKEIETWKQLVAKTPAGLEREAAEDQIRNSEKSFLALQKSERLLFKKLISGERLIIKAQNKRKDLDALFHRILTQGFLITIGEPDSNLSFEQSDRVKVTVPVTLKLNNWVRPALEKASQEYGGRNISASFKGRPVSAIRVAQDYDLATYFYRKMSTLSFVLSLVLEDGVNWSCQIIENYPLATVAEWGTGEKSNEIRRLGIATAKNTFVAVSEEVISFLFTEVVPISTVKALKEVRVDVRELPDGPMARSCGTRLQGIDIKAPGLGPAFNEYLARIQGMISEQWVPPPVDLRGPLQVTIRFRLHRSGRVSDVAVERTSGNGYYDDAGKRAVQAAGPLPPFPPEMTNQDLDARFVFSVGQEAG